MERDRAELGAFLKARRAALTPAQAGIEAFPGARRVAGLRRDELAYLAGLSPDYLSRLEQGRQTNISVTVLDALARALRLDQVESAHLRDLADPAPPGPADGSAPPQRADPGLLRVMAALDHVPALLLGLRSEVLARNALLPAVVGRPMQPGASFVRYLFQDPMARERILNWEQFAEMGVAGLRREAARYPHDRILRALIAELRAGSADVARWWADHAVRDHSSMTKRIRHPMAGDLTFDIEMVVGPADPDQRLIIYTCEPDSPTAHALPLLASWQTA